MKAVGILVHVGTFQSSSQMVQIFEIANILLLQSGTSVSNGVLIGEDGSELTD